MVKIFYFRRISSLANAQQVTSIVGDDSATVSSIVGQNGTWNITSISHEHHEAIKSVPLPVTLELEDSVYWSPNGNGKFSTASCYKFILESNGVINKNEFNWDWI